MSTSEDGGSCVVCGTATYTRCSACLKAGLDWMFFCSKEHQKLIWPVHKRICGSHPFEWPTLSQEEIDEYVEFSTKATPASSSSLTSWIEDQAKMPENSHKSIEQVQLDFRALLEVVGPSNGVLSDEATSCLVSIRSSAFCYRLLSAYPSCERLLDECRPLIASHPFDYLAYLEDIAVPDVVSAPSNSSWLSDFRHRFLIYHYLYAISTENSIARYEFMAKAQGIFKQFARQEIQETHPREAGRVIVMCSGALLTQCWPIYEGTAAPSNYSI